MAEIFNLTTNSLPFFHQAAIVLINTVGASVVATVVIHHSLRTRLAQAFVALGILMFLWVDFAYFARLVGANNYFWSEIFLRVAWSATPLFFSFVYLVTVYIVHGADFRQHFNSVIILFGLILSSITGFTNYIVEGIKFRGTNLDIIYGSQFYPFLATILIIIIATLVQLFKKHPLTVAQEKTHVFVIGVLAFYVLNVVFNIYLPAIENISHLYFFGDYSLIIVVVSAGYSILRYRLLNIRVIATELFIFTLWFFIFTRIFLAYTRIDQLINVGFFAAVLILGTFLLKSVRREVSMREKMEEMAVKLEVANDELKRLDAAKSDFISIASHQLRSPLSIIKGYIAMIREGTFGKLDQKFQDPLEKVYISNERLINLVSDLLDLSRMERGKMQYDFKPLHLLNVIDGIVSDFRIVAQKKGLDFSWQPEKVNDLINGDENKLRQIILNLVDNAVKYTSAGKITVSLKSEGKDKIKFSIEDTGPGLAREEALGLFQKFVRGREERKSHTEGLGLGLYVAKLIAQAHNGELSVISPGKGKGSTFSLVLPVKN